jgi:hypothetical protein
MHWRRSAVLFLFSILALSNGLAQKADLAFTAGGSIVSDSNENFLCIAELTCVQQQFKTGHQFAFQAAAAYRFADAGPASFYLELPVAVIPSQRVTLTGFSGTLAHINSAFVTPSLRVKLLPRAPISPFVSFGAGWARYSLTQNVVNKGALQYGGGLDVKTLFPHLDLRFEVRDFVTGNPGFLPSRIVVGNQLFTGTLEGGLHHHNVLPSAGIVFRF